jgi:alkylation response protein AidB-like acyl-CoA dehydrogenase
MEEGNLDLRRETAREFARGTIGPVVMKYDEAHVFHHDLIRPLAELGFLGAMTPESYGGAGLSQRDFTVLVEEVSAVDASVGLTLCAHNGLCLGHINRFVSEDQKRRFLPDLCSGKKLGGWGLTEPGSGSDSAGMQTAAARDGSSGTTPSSHRWASRRLPP